MRRLISPANEMYQTLLAQIRAHVQYKLRSKIPALRHLVDIGKPIEWWLSKLTDKTRFIQIGSNDGAQGDPLHNLIIKGFWEGILVEPIPFLFEKLKENYAGRPKLVFLNAAVSSKRESRELYYVAPEGAETLDLPFWHDQLGSFDRSHIVRHLGNDIEPYIRFQIVDCVLLDDVIAASRFDAFDLLHIDVEGHDYEIFRQLDLTRYTPKMILLEMKHLTADNRGAVIRSLTSHGYQLLFSPADALAVRLDVYSEIISAPAG